MTAHYTRSQERALRDAVAAGRAPSCPACGVALEIQSVPPRSDVSYVRTRRWLRCGGCGRSLVVDVPRGAAGP